MKLWRVGCDFQKGGDQKGEKLVECIGGGAVSIVFVVLLAYFSA